MSGAPAGASDETGRQPRTPPQPLFHRPHGAPVPLVIVAQKVQKAMQGENPIFGAEGMAGLAGLPCGNARGNHDITKEPGWPNDGPSRQIGPKRQDVGDMIDTPEPPIQGADLTVPDEGERHAPACAARRRPSQPIGQPPDAQRTSGSIGDRHIETPAAALSLGWHDIQEWRPLLPLENDS